MMRRLFCAVAALGALVVASAAQASDYSFSFSAAGGSSGDITATGVIDLANTPKSDGSYLATRITGSVNGVGITGLSTYAAADNDVSTRAPYFDLSGLSFSTATIGDFNVYSTGSGDVALRSTIDPVGYPSNGSPVTTISLTPVSGAPEPSAWALMLGGVGVLGGLLRVAQARRREDEAAGRAIA